MHHRWHPSCILLLDLMIYLKIVKQYKHMAINDCPETASETCFQKKKLAYAYVRSKIPEKFKFPMHSSIQNPNGKKFSLKFDNLVYSVNHAKS